MLLFVVITKMMMTVSMKMFKSTTWHQAFHCVMTMMLMLLLIMVMVVLIMVMLVVLMSKDAVERYDLAAKCYRQALNCVKETPALGEREKTLHHITLHYITSHYITLYYITLHYIR